jgi:hypothetical protein
MKPQQLSQGNWGLRSLSPFYCVACPHFPHFPI